MGVLSRLKFLHRTSQLVEDLEEASEHPTLYLDPVWRSLILKRTTSVVEVAPIPPSLRSPLVKFIQNIYKSPSTTLFGLGAAVLELMSQGLTFKAAVIAATVAALGITHGGLAESK